MRRIFNFGILNPQKLTLLFFVTLIFIQLLMALFRPNFEMNFGAEYGRIAKSIVTDNGYSNPFPGETGPTAWMLPLLVFIITAFFYLKLTIVQTFILLTLIKYILLSFCFYFTLRLLTLFKLVINYTLFFSIFIIFILFSPDQNFEKISDLWITVFFASLFSYAYYNFYIKSKTKGFILLIITFILSPLVNVSYTLGFVLIVFGTFLYSYWSIFFRKNKIAINHETSILAINNKKQFRIYFSKHLVFASALLISISLWTYRNYLVFDKIIPSKSNMWFEFYLTNIVDTDGQLSFSTSFRGHPNNREDLRVEIKRQGEIEWIEKYHQHSIKFLESNFDIYISKVSFRLFNAFIFIENDMDAIDIDNNTQINKNDLLILKNNRLTNGRQWICLFYDDNEMQQILNEIQITDKKSVVIEWKNAKLDYARKKYSISNIVRSISMSLIPLISIILLFFVSSVRKNPVFIVSVILYIIYLIPYVLISHQIRYQRPLFILQILFIYLILSILLNTIISTLKSEKANKMFRI